MGICPMSIYFGIPPGMKFSDVTGWYYEPQQQSFEFMSTDQSHLDNMDTDSRHKWLAPFHIQCKCKECQNEQ